MNCSAPNCGNQAARRGLCWTHIKREDRARKAAGVNCVRRAPLEALQEAAADYIDAESEPDGEEHFRVATLALAGAAVRYARSVDRCVDNGMHDQEPGEQGTGDRDA